VSADVLGHTESTDPVVAEDLGHLLVGVEELLVLGVLEVVLLDVGPQLLDALGPGSLLLADDVSELGGELHGLGESGSLRHVESWLVFGAWSKIERKDEPAIRNKVIVTHKRPHCWKTTIVRTESFPKLS